MSIPHFRVPLMSLAPNAAIDRARACRLYHTNFASALRSNRLLDVLGFTSTSQPRSAAGPPRSRRRSRLVLPYHHFTLRRTRLGAAAPFRLLPIYLFAIISLDQVRLTSRISGRGNSIDCNMRNSLPALRCMRLLCHAPATRRRVTRR